MGDHNNESPKQQKKSPKAQNNQSEPPRFLYQSQRFLVTELKKNDFITCVAFRTYNSLSYIVFGTKKGWICYSKSAGIATWNRLHARRVNDVYMNETCTFIGSCSDDGKISILNIINGDKEEYHFASPISCVSLEPLFNKPSGGFILCFKNGSVNLSIEGIFTRKILNLDHVHSVISTLKWRRQFIVFAHREGVTVFDVDKTAKVGFIKKPKSADPEARCYLCWRSTSEVIIGWGKDICIVSIANQEQVFGSTSHLIFLMTLKVNDIICGVGPCDKDVLVLQHTVESKSGKIKKSSMLSLLSTDPMEEEVLLSHSKIKFSGNQNIDPKDYSLTAYGDTFVAHNTVDIIFITQMSVDARITYMLENRKFDAALRLANSYSHELVLHRIDDIEHYYVDFLFTHQRYDKIIELIKKDKIFLDHLAVFEQDIMQKLELGQNDLLVLMLAKIALAKSERKIVETMVHYMRQVFRFRQDIKTAFEIELEIAEQTKLDQNSSQNRSTENQDVIYSGQPNDQIKINQESIEPIDHQTNDLNQNYFDNKQLS